MMTGRNAGHRPKIWSKMINFIALWGFQTGSDGSTGAAMDPPGVRGVITPTGEARRGEKY